MIWFSEHTSASQFVAAVRKDPDFVFVAKENSRVALTVSGALETDPNMAVFGQEYEWRVNLTKQGRRPVPTIIKVRKRCSKAHMAARICIRPSSALSRS